METFNVGEYSIQGMFFTESTGCLLTFELTLV